MPVDSFLTIKRYWSGGGRSPKDGGTAACEAMSVPAYRLNMYGDAVRPVTPVSLRSGAVDYMRDLLSPYRKDNLW